jgi:hypothetical protein
MSGKLKPATHTKKNERIGRANRTDTDAVRFGNTGLRGLGNLDTPFLPGATGDGQDALPLADLIDRPGLLDYVLDEGFTEPIYLNASGEDPDAFYKNQPQAWAMPPIINVSAPIKLRMTFKPVVIPEISLVASTESLNVTARLSVGLKP